MSDTRHATSRSLAKQIERPPFEEELRGERLRFRGDRVDRLRSAMRTSRLMRPLRSAS